MACLIRDKSHIKSHKYAFYDTEVTFQWPNRPSGIHEEAKRYFSNKYNFCGFKTDDSALQNGLALADRIHYAGPGADLEFFRRSLQYHTRLFRKTEDEGNYFNGVGTLAVELEGFGL